MDKLSHKITSIMTKNGIVKSDDYDIYIYGFEKILFTTSNIITSLIIGITLDKVSEIVIFQMAYSQLRKYVGGYHCKKK